MKSFKKEVKELESIEKKAVRYMYRLKNPFESEKLMWDMRHEWNQKMDLIKENYPEEWEQYCDEHNLVTDYNFGDVLA